MSRALADEMVAHCMAERPNEACGMLAAVDNEVVKVFPMRNQEASPLRYSMVPLEYKSVEDEIDAHGWRLVGGFHSHTRTEAYPSPTDVARAFGDMVHVIVSLASDPPVIRAYKIIKQTADDEDGEIQEVPVAITG